MSRARFLAAAQRDLVELRFYLTRASGSLAVAQEFTARLRERCQRLAALPGTLGTARNDLEPGLRVVPFRDYLIFFRYLDSHVQIVRILHGMRDVPTAIDCDHES